MVFKLEIKTKELHAFILYIDNYFGIIVGVLISVMLFITILSPFKNKWCLTSYFLFAINKFCFHNQEHVNNVFPILSLFK